MWPVRTVSHPSIESVLPGRSTAPSASRSLSRWFLSASSSCLRPSHFQLHPYPPAPHGQAAETERQPWLALVFVSMCECVCICIFSCLFGCHSSYTTEGWSGVTARITHAICWFCPLLRSSNPTVVVYGWFREKQTFSGGREEDHAPAFQLFSSSDDY